METVSLGPWEFHLNEHNSTLYISGPDRGGMMDSVPRVAEQLEWAEQAFATVPALRRVWATSWEVPPEALDDLRALMQRSGADWPSAR